jgi:short-subunit dehydrogenase
MTVQSRAVAERRRIEGLLVAVTGADRGIGLATARALSARGARVVGGDLPALDVTSRESFAAWLDAAGPIDALVNNAGVMHVGPFLEESDEWTRRQVDVNLHGVILGMKLALPAMVARGSGHVVNVASAAAKIGVPREAVYAASKHAVLGLSESVRLELRGTGVDLSVVMPGLVRTELAAGTLRGGLVLKPEDVAQAIVATLERPRFDVHVPRAYAAISALGALLPRSAREAMLRLAGSERATAQTTPEQRAAYESRIESAGRHPPGKVTCDRKPGGLGRTPG